MGVEYGWNGGLRAWIKLPCLRASHGPHSLLHFPAPPSLPTPTSPRASLQDPPRLGEPLSRLSGDPASFALLSAGSAPLRCFQPPHLFCAPLCWPHLLTRASPLAPPSPRLIGLSLASSFTWPRLPPVPSSDWALSGRVSFRSVSMFRFFFCPIQSMSTSLKFGSDSP